MTDEKNCNTVTPLAGVWIEIKMHVRYDMYFLVTPLAGVWIEIAPAEPANKK